MGLGFRVRVRVRVWVCLGRSEDGARPAEEGEGGGAAETAAAQHQPWRETVEGDAADEQRGGPGKGPR